MQTKAVDTLRRYATLAGENLDRRVAWTVKVALVAVNAPSVWRVMGAITQNVAGWIAFTVKFSSNVLIDGVFLWTLTRLERQRDEPLVAKWLDIGMACISWAAVLAIGWADHQNIAGTIVRLAGLVVIVMSVKDSVVDYQQRLHDERMARTGTETKKQAKIREEQELARFQAREEAETRAVQAEAAADADIRIMSAKTRVEIETDALSAGRETQVQQRTESITAPPTERAAAELPVLNRHAVVQHEGGYGVFCPYTREILTTFNGPPYQNRGQAFNRLEEHVKDCPAGEAARPKG